MGDSTSGRQAIEIPRHEATLRCDATTPAAQAGGPAAPRPPTGRTRRGPFDWRAFRADLRATVPDASAALLLTAAIFVWLAVRVENGTSSTTQVMPVFDDAGTSWMYLLSQAFGWSGLLWAWITVMLGLLRSSVFAGALPVPVPRLERWHRTTSLTTIALIFAHAVMFFLFEVQAPFEEQALSWGWVGSVFADVFIPGVYDSGTGVIAILVGLLAFYLAIPLGLAYYVRHRTGSRVWRALHRFIIVVYALSVWHTLLYGTNVWYDGTFRATVWSLQLPIAGLLLMRLLSPARPDEQLRIRTSPGGQLSVGTLVGLAGRVGVAAIIVVLLAVTVSGRDGGRTPGVAGAELNTTIEMVWCGLAATLAAVIAVVLNVRRSQRRRRTA